MSKVALISFLTMMLTLSGVAYYSISQNKNLVDSTKELKQQAVIYQQWIDWVDAHQKNYKTEEIPLKFQAFSKNYQIVEEHNSNPSNTYTLGLNKFADITNEEFTANLLKQHVNLAQNQQGDYSNDQELTLPTSVNWTAKGAVTPVKNQQQCGSSPYFAIAGSVEGINYLKNKMLESLSIQQLVDCTQSYGNAGCCGAQMDPTYQYIMKFGMETEQKYPYKGVDQNCSYNAKFAQVKIKGYQDVALNNSLALQKAVAVQPVAAVIASNNAVQLYKSGIINDPTCYNYLEHGVLITGYAVEKNQHYWMVKNSWGADWGVNGYLFIAFNPAQINDIQLIFIYFFQKFILFELKTLEFVELI